MSCTYTFQGKTYSVSEFHDLLAAMPAEELMKHLPDEARQKISMASQSGVVRQTDTPAFKKWFGDSKVVDSDGNPLVVYHGTKSDFDTFSLDSHFGTKDQADTILAEKRGNVGKRVIPVYLSIKKMKRVSDQEIAQRWSDAVAKAKKQGYDGLIYRNEFEGDGTKDSYIAFYPEQIKSAIGNNGEFDGRNPDIRYEVDENGDPSVEEAEFVHRGIEGKDPIGVAEWVANNAPSQYASIASAVAEKLKTVSESGVKLGMSITYPGDMAESQMGAARGGTFPFIKDGALNIKVSVNGAGMTGRVGTSFRTVLHELVHASTIQALRSGERQGSYYEQATRDLYDVANAILEHTRSIESKDKDSLTDFERSLLEGRNNMLGSVDEVVAWALSSEQAQKYLESIPYKSKSLWTAFVEAVRQAIGLRAKNDTALSEVLRVSEILLKPADPYEMLVPDDLKDKQMIDVPRLKKRSANGYEFDVQHPGGGYAESFPGGVSETTWVGDVPRNGNDGNSGIRASVSFNTLDYAEKLAKSDSQIANKLSHVFSAIGGDTTNSFGWFNKTLSSQFHKAKINPAFGRVFHHAQSFIEDVARYATEAADRAPDLLPKSETMAQVWRQIKNAKRDAADQKAIAAPIFEGTLFEGEDGQTGKVWTDTELRKKYNLNDRQIGLYRQYRNTINSSLEEMAIAEMNKVARANELEMPPGDLVMDELARFYSSQYAEKLRALRERYDQHTKAYEANDKQMKLNAESLKLTREKYHQAKVIMDSNYASEQALMNREIESLEKLDKAFTEKAATVKKLQRDGYAPLMRFGKYTVDVVEMVPAKDDNGNTIIDQDTGEMVMEKSRVFFSRFEKESEARDTERAMSELYPNAIVSRGTYSEDGWQLFGAINPGSLEALIELTGKEDELIQQFYKDAVSNRSALKRLIHREGIAGYSNDVVRGLASFVMSNARATASADHVGDMVKAVAEIDKKNGDVKDEAIKLVNYIQNPNEEAGTLRGLLFLQFLGGSVAAALVNLTQTISTTFPYLSQYGVTPAALVKASVVAGKRMKGGSAEIDPELGHALARAEDEGVVSPHNIHAIMGNSGVQGFANNKALRLFNSVWGSMFGMAEQFNREIAFIAAFEAAQKMGESGLRKAYQKQSDLYASRGLPPPDSRHFADAFSFAKNAVNETQFVLSKAARPNWARGAVGATLMTFQQFKLFYLELFSRLPPKEKAVMLASLVLLAGLSGVPGADDLDDIIDTLGQMAGYNTNSRKWKDQAIIAAFGDNKMAADFVSSGVSAFLPLDVAGRLGMGNLVPATGILKKSNTGNVQKQMSEMLGAAGGFFNQVTDAWGYALKGRYDLAITQGIAPKAIKDLHKAIEMARTGVYDDMRGRRVTDVTPLDAFVKALGFQPKDVADLQKVKGYQMQDIALVKAVKASVSEMWAAGINDRDTAMTADARQILADWNAKNPEAQIKIDKGAIQRRVNQMKLTAQERLVKTAPKEMRASVKAAFAE